MATWRRVGSGLLVGVTELVIPPDGLPESIMAFGPDGIWEKSTGSWVNHANPTGMDYIYEAVGFVTPGGAIGLSVATADGKTHIHKTLDYGATWSDIRPSGWGLADVTAPGLAALDALTYYVNAYGTGADGGYWRTLDGGTTWTRIIDPAGYIPNMDVGEPFDVRGSILYISANDDLVTNPANQIHTAALDGTSIVDLAISAVNAVGVRASPETSTRAWAYRSRFTFDPPKVYRIDSGVVTDVTPSGIISTDYINCVEFRDDNTGLCLVRDISTAAKLYRTTNGGGSWTDITPGSFDANGIPHRDIVYDSGNTKWWIAGFFAGAGTIWYSTDDGLTWTKDATFAITDEVFSLAISGEPV